MRCLKIWLTVIVVFVTFTCIDTSKKLDLMRRGKARVRYSCRHRDVCKNGGTCVGSRKHGWFRKCICPDGWTGRRCNDPMSQQVCKNKRFCKNGGTLMCSGRSRRSWKCICTDGWTGRHCGDFIDDYNDENKDFISVILNDHQMQHIQNIQPYIFMTTDTSTNVNITTSEKLLEDHITEFNSSVTIPYPDFGINDSSNLNAIRIRSTESISVAVNVRQDITTLISNEKLSTSYIPSPPYKDLIFDTFAAMTVTAIQDDTRITFSESWGSTFPEYTLNALETRVHEYHGRPTKTYSIQSSKPVAVFCGLYCRSDANCSNMIEHIPPSNQLDTVYIIPPYYDRPLTLSLLLSQKNTTISYSNETDTIIAGRRRVLFTPQNETMVVRSGDPILMTSYALKGLHLDDESPYWIVVPGVNQYLPRYKVIIPNGWETNYITIMIRKSAVNGLRVDKQSINTNTIRFENNVFVEDLEYSVIIAEVTEGELTLESIDKTPFGLMVYGTRGRAVYGFAGNVILR